MLGRSTSATRGLVNDITASTAYNHEQIRTSSRIPDGCPGCLAAGLASAVVQFG